MPSFDEKVLSLTSQIPRGKVTTYAEIAHALGSQAYRAVGNALNRNPHGFLGPAPAQKTLQIPLDSPALPRVPCHRVVKSDGSIGGFAHGAAKKIALLEQESIPVRDGRVVGLEHVIYRF